MRMIWQSLIPVLKVSFFSSRRRHTRWPRDWSSDVCSSDLGSLVTADRLRFDFSQPAALTREQISSVERKVNAWIQADLEVKAETVSLETARERGAMMLFGEKYGSEVRMVSMGDASVELCGGTHVQRTGQIGLLVITEDSAVSAGVRRVTALVGRAAVEWLQEQRSRLAGLAEQLGAPADALAERASKLQADLREARREIKTLQDRLAAAQTGGAADAGPSGEVEGVSWAARQLTGLDASALRNAADTMLQQRDLGVAVLASGSLLVIKVSAEARERGAHAGNLVRALAEKAGGRGGGRPDMAQGGIKESQFSPALQDFPELLRQQLSG